MLLRQEEVPTGIRGDLLALWRLVDRMSADFHPLIRRLVDTAEPDATVLNLFATGRRPRRWAMPRATMMGDAVHVMPPFGAHGGNTALRDAALLGHKLVEARANGTPVEEAIDGYQDEMVPLRLPRRRHRQPADAPTHRERRRTPLGADPGVTSAAPGDRTGGMIAGMSHEPARASAIADLMRAGRETSRLAMVFRYAIAERLGLTVSDLECLDYLADVGSATAGQVAERTNLTTGAVTSMLRRLQQAGYVTAERDPADRRRVIVTLRPERIAELERPYERFAERAERLIEGYSVEEVKLLVRHYDRMQAMYLAELDRLRSGDTAQRSA